MLVNLWDAALKALDEGKDAVVLLGVDFQKAFNRMEYAACLRQLERLGASQGSLAMVHSFLEGRKMKMKLGNHTSETVNILRGSPQGSVMGCALYCATTQALELPARDVGIPPRIQPGHTPPSPGTTGAGIAGIERFPALPRGVLQPRLDIRFLNDPDLSEDDDSVIPAQGPDQSNGEPPLRDGNPSRERSLGSVKYIDDTTLLHAVPLTEAVRHCTTATTLETLEPGGLTMRFAGLINNADDIGMVINCAKTQLLCMSPNNGCKTVARIHTPDGPVDSVDKLKLVGFVFGSEPNAAAHVGHLLEKFRVKVWLLFHLREAGIKNDKLFKLYCVYIRSMLEYCSPVYHSILTAGQAETLERLQRHAARVCYGSDQIREVMAQRGIENLETRRQARVDRFILKTVSSTRFGPEWYQRRAEVGHNLRERRTFFEAPTRTARAFNNPRNYFVRRANQLGLDWGQ